ncbi:hypothetical protein DFQ27_003603 [Actinomortierella ambigua]|uniref:Uncharacterized protein n=1 Tax=Actinomortierella ambigua TaxID=1343610 RepID=A0A9P6Q7S5_9FUNG|nr:hypothetical protein DFQ27_003603 [Actinomortierella ambigua]
MDSIVIAAATVYNDILMVQYSPTGNGVGDLYAIWLKDMTKPLPFQIQRLSPGLRSLNHRLASMSLTTLHFKSPAPSKSLANGPDGGGTSPVDTAPQLLAQSPIDPNTSQSAAVTPAPPFGDLVLAMNRDDLKANLQAAAFHRALPSHLRRRLEVNLVQALTLGLRRPANFLPRFGLNPACHNPTFRLP